jgi:hypothetical protein
MSTRRNLIHRTHPQSLKRLVIQLPTIITAHARILPDHPTTVDLLTNSLVINEEEMKWSMRK